MTNFLKEIHSRKQREVSALKNIYTYKEGKKDRSFRQALEKRGVIAEIKRRSPSKGALAEIPHPEKLAKEYEEAGAIAISCLTDAAFGASIEDLKAVAAHSSLPILRKDFIIDPVQIVEAKQCGASAVLLIVKLVGDNLKFLLEAVGKIGVEALVEVHTKDELDMALQSGADIIGINNRDLTTFNVEPRISFELFQSIPEGIHTVIESGITEPKTAHFFFDHGVSACLIGEKLVQVEDKKQFIQNTKNSYVKICGVSSKEIAQYAAKAGADFIGIICDKNSPRYVLPEYVDEIAQEAKMGGANPVCVFTYHTFEQMRSLCMSSGISVVQLHGEISRKEHISLPRNFIRFFVQPVEKNGSFIPIDFQGLNPKRDYILYDFKEAGSGISFDWEKFTPIKNIPFFLAGGLSPDNISSAKNRVKAHGYDVSSGVENRDREKDAGKIQDFITRVKM